MTFNKWILEFIEVNLPIGDVAREINLDTDFPKSNDYNVIFSYLENRMPDNGIEAFKNAWQFYISSR